MDESRRVDGVGWRGVSAALLAGLLLRLVFLHVHPRFLGDALTYGDLAHNMLKHHVFGFTEGDAIRSTLIRLPGYPVFLAACFGVFGDANYLAVLWVQIAVDLATCALLGVLAARLMGRRAGLAAVWLAALCPFTANYAVAALTETLSLFCVALAFFALERWVARWRGGEFGIGWAAAGGVAAAGAVSIRPDQGLVAAAVVPVMVWVGLQRAGFVRGLGPAVVAAAIVVLPLGLWAGRNWRVFHVVQPLAPRYANDPGEDVPYGFQRWYRTWAIDFKSTVDVYWNYDGNLMRLEDLPARAFDDEEQLAQTRAVYAAYNAETSASPALDAAFARIAQERVAAHPLRYYVAMPVARELNMWLRPRTELMKMPLDWWAVRAHPGRSMFEIAYALLNAAYLVLGVVGFWWWVRGARGGAVVVWAMVGFMAMRCALLLTIDNSEPRYVLECFPVVMVMAGFALARGNGISEESASRTC
jgi:4-amino-4-deoxy-L-arabinose transferase-like glycosyltransferase